MRLFACVNTSYLAKRILIYPNLAYEITSPAMCVVIPVRVSEFPKIRRTFLVVSILGTIVICGLLGPNCLGKLPHKHHCPFNFPFSFALDYSPVLA